MNLQTHSRGHQPVPGATYNAVIRVTPTGTIGREIGEPGDAQTPPAPAESREGDRR